MQGTIPTQSASSFPSCFWRLWIIDHCLLPSLLPSSRLLSFSTLGIYQHLSSQTAAAAAVAAAAIAVIVRLLSFSPPLPPVTINQIGGGSGWLAATWVGGGGWEALRPSTAEGVRAGASASHKWLNLECICHCRGNACSITFIIFTFCRCCLEHKTPNWLKFCLFKLHISYNSTQKSTLGSSLW